MLVNLEGLNDGSIANVNHFSQRGYVKEAEVSESSHQKRNEKRKSVLHGQFNGKANPEHPVDRSECNAERTEYWKNRAKQIE